MERRTAKKILLTRPRAASERWTALLQQYGFDCLTDPLLRIDTLDTPRPAGSFAAVLITSAHAPDSLAARAGELAGLTDLPCFCVGAATGHAARRAGFSHVICGDNDGAALARQVIAAHPPGPSGPLLHIAGAVARETMENTLTEAGFDVTAWRVYAAVAATGFAPATREALSSGGIGAVPVFSPRSAGLLTEILMRENLSEACRDVTAMGLSQAVADILDILPWRQIKVAAAPNEEAMLDCLIHDHL